MAIQADYITGTLTVTNGSTAFTGTGTGWQLAGFREGDTIIDITGATEYMGVIATIDANGAGTLTKAWEGPTLADVAYRMRYQPDGSRVTAQARSLIELLSGKAFFQYDASGDLPERDNYDEKRQGFSFLDTSTTPMGIYVKASDASGDWAGPSAYVQGETGPAPNLSIGTVTTGAPGTDAAATVGGTNPNYTVGFTIPRGDQGFQGWAIEPELVNDGATRRVIRVADWIGGAGAKPSGIGQYVGPAGLTSDLSQAISVRGDTGPTGPRGVEWKGVWDGAVDYETADLVTDPDANDDPAIWIALQPNTNSKPRGNAAAWDFFPGTFGLPKDYGLITEASDAFTDYGTIA